MIGPYSHYTSYISRESDPKVLGYLPGKLQFIRQDLTYTDQLHLEYSEAHLEQYYWNPESRKNFTFGVRLGDGSEILWTPVKEVVNNDSEILIIFEPLEMA